MSSVIPKRIRNTIALFALDVFKSKGNSLFSNDTVLFVWILAALLAELTFLPFRAFDSVDLVLGRLRFVCLLRFKFVDAIQLPVCFFFHSVYLHLPQENRSLWLAILTPHLGQNFSAVLYALIFFSFFSPAIKIIN